MAESFDPYRKWLAIPIEEQPPHYYRLLAIPLFESDPDVISNAADGRMSQIKSFQTGPYGRLSQQILNQISVAKICLLDPIKKAAYDCQLKQRLTVASPQCGRAAPQIEGADLATTDAASFDFTGNSRVLSSRHRSAKKAKTNTQPWRVFAVLGGGLIAAAVAAFFILYNNSPAKDAGSVANRQAHNDTAPAPESKAETKPKSQPAPLASAQKNANDSQNHAVPKTSSGSPPENPKPKLELASDSGHGPMPDGQSVEPAEPIGNEKPLPSGPVNVVAADPAVEAGSNSTKRLPVPEKSLQQAADAKVREVFHEEFAAAKTSEAHAALAKKLLAQADGSKDDAAAYYVLLKTAGDQAVLAGDVGRALNVVDTMRDRYQIDLSKKADVLAAMLRSSGTDKTAASAIFDAAMGLGDEALARDDFELAEKLGKTAAMAGRKTREAEQVRAALARGNEIAQLKARFAVVQKALDTLQTDASDGAANLVAGQWYCLARENWEKGLPMLAKSDREDLAQLAKQDLAAPNEAKQQVALADAWWSLGEKEPPARKNSFQERARHWYALALDKTAGLEKARIQKRLDEETAIAAAASKPLGRDVTIDLTSLPYSGKMVVLGKTYDMVVDSLDIPNGYKLAPPTVPGATVRHFFFMHARTRLEINLESKVKTGVAAKRFKAFLYLDPISRPGSDGIVWTVEAGNKSRVKLLLTTVQSQDFNPVDLALPPGTTHIVIQSFPGAANNYDHDWGIMANPVVVFRK